MTNWVPSINFERELYVRKWSSDLLYKNKKENIQYFWNWFWNSGIGSGIFKLVLESIRNKDKQDGDLNYENAKADLNIGINEFRIKKIFQNSE